MPRRPRSSPPAVATGAVAKDLARDLTAWKKAVADGGAGTQAEAANQPGSPGESAEGQRVRLATARGRRGARPQAIADFNGTAPPQALVQAYNRAVRAYEHDRNDSLRKPVAKLFGYDARPVLVIGT